MKNSVLTANELIQRSWGELQQALADPTIGSNEFKLKVDQHDHLINSLNNIDKPGADPDKKLMIAIVLSCALASAVVVSSILIPLILLANSLCN